MKYRMLMFDLDGTLTDSREGIVRSIEMALARMGREIPDGVTMNRFIGPSLYTGFQEILGFSPEDSSRAVALFRERYQKEGIYENRVFPGIPQVLDALKSHYTLAVATAKPEISARVVLDHFDLTSRFETICGASLDLDRIHKDQVIARVLEEHPEMDPGEILMIGDRIHDIEGARANGTDVAAVLYGYGDREELAGADYLVDGVEDLRTLLLPAFREGR